MSNICPPLKNSISRRRLGKGSWRPGGLFGHFQKKSYTLKCQLWEIHGPSQPFFQSLKPAVPLVQLDILCHHFFNFLLFYNILDGFFGVGFQPWIWVVLEQDPKDLDPSVLDREEQGTSTGLEIFIKKWNSCTRSWASMLAPANIRSRIILGWSRMTAQWSGVLFSYANKGL